MKRRDFLKSSAGAGPIASAIPARPSASVAGGLPEKTAPISAAILKSFTPEDHRRRLQNIARCEQGVRQCLRKHLITDYLPGQCVYHLGEYPARKIWDPDDWDEQELDRLKAHNIGMIHLHEEWNDVLRLYGGHKFAPANPAGFRRFIDMVHRRGMKVIVYISTGFFQQTDPDFRPEWTRQLCSTRQWLPYQWVWCSPASAGWRAYLLKHIARILDEYGVDGLYNDSMSFSLSQTSPTPDEVLAFEETSAHDGAFEDLMAIIYAEVKRRGGIVKVHQNANEVPRTRLKIYDYLWVGETVQNIDKLRDEVKNHPPYVVPCLDMSVAKIEREEELYLQAIPYMQFPVLLGGHPLTGDPTLYPGNIFPPESDVTKGSHKHMDYYRAHPNDPPKAGCWDSVPGRPEMRPTHAKWLKQYLPMVEEGTWAYLEITDSNLFAQPLPANVVASAFANRDLYLVLANYGQSPVEIETADAYIAVDDNAAGSQKRWKLERRSLHILRGSA